MRYKITIGLIIVILLSTFSGSIQGASAEGAYEGYNYNSAFDETRSVNGYLYTGSIIGENYEYGALKGPEDIFITPDHSVYIADTGNNRILHLDSSSQLLGIYGDQEGDGKLNTPRGIFVNKNGEVYVADTMNRRIVVFEKGGKFLRQFGTPQSPLLGESFSYSPSKLIVDKRGYMFVISDGSDKGLMQLDPLGNFKGFFGANHVPFNWGRVILRFTATDEQKAQLAKVRPPSFSNVHLGEDGYVYTSTFGARFNQIKRLSAVGVDTLNGGSNRYGDLYVPSVNYEALYESFVDLTVDSKGNITIIDQTMGKVFQYDKIGNLVFIFGGLGQQNGLFKTPAAIAVAPNDSLYIADKSRNRIDVFGITPFGEKVHTASHLYSEGEYEAASIPWHEVLLSNSNFDLAYKSLGKSLYKSEQYEEAMEYFKLAGDRAGYSLAFLEFRKDFVRQHFAELLGLIAAACILYVIYQRWSKRRKRARGKRQEVFLTNPLSMMGMVLKRPHDFFYEIQFHGRARWYQAIVMIGLMIVTHLIALTLVSFHFETREAYQISALVEIGVIIIPWITWVIANWAISVILDGEGKFKDILISSTFVLTPYILFIVPMALLTNIISLQEKSFYTGMFWIVIVWVLYLIVVQIQEIHDFEGFKIVWIMFLTLIGMFLIWFIGFLLYGLIQQLIYFFIDIYKELEFRA